jgi:hypothetical protein
MDGDPEHDVFVEDSLAIIIRRGEADRQHRRDANATARILEKRDDLRSNRLLPELILEDRVVRCVSGLLRDDGEPFPRDDEGMLEEIGTVEEKRMVLRDAGIEVDALEDRDEVRLCLGNDGEEPGLAGRGRGW